MGGLRQFIRVFDSGGNAKVKKAKGHLDEIKIALQEIKDTLASFEELEDQRNVCVAAIATSMSVQTPDQIRIAHDDMRTRYHIYNHRYNLLSEDKNATKAANEELVNKVTILKMECTNTNHELTATAAKVSSRARALESETFGCTPMEDDAQPASLLYRKSTKYASDGVEVMYDLCEF